MKVHRPQSISPAVPNPPQDKLRAIAIGNFDGCHLGHQKLISLTKRLQPELISTSLTFDPHPSEVVRRAPVKSRRLFTVDQKIRAFEELGLQEVVVQNFSAAFSELTPSGFLNEYLKEALQCRAIIVGDNFCFGKDRAGNATWLSQAATASGMTVSIVTPENSGEGAVSTTRIRQALSSGNVELANQMLGRPYLLEGFRKSDQKFGRKIGTPTLNLSDIDQMLPRNGVYAGWVHLAENAQAHQRPIFSTPPNTFPAAINIGTRPTVTESNDRVHIEAHAIGTKLKFDLHQDTSIGLYITGRIRDEQKFASFEDLKKQIDLDIAKARQLLSL